MTPQLVFLTAVTLCLVVLANGQKPTLTDMQLQEVIDTDKAGGCAYDADPQPFITCVREKSKGTNLNTTEEIYNECKDQFSDPNLSGAAGYCKTLDDPNKSPEDEIKLAMCLFDVRIKEDPTQENLEKQFETAANVKEQCTNAK